MFERVVFDDKASHKFKPLPAVLTMVCMYLFLAIERPWESIRYMQGIPLERIFAVLMIIVAFLRNKFIIVNSPTNKWVYSLLVLHFILAPFAYRPNDALDQGIEYAKMVVIYLLMLASVDDEMSLQLLVRSFVFTMMFYVMHSLWEYDNGRYVYRMGISRMVGADKTFNDPNAFGASVVLSLPFAYTLLHSEINARLRWLYYVYFMLAVVCVVLTGSRSAFVALVFLLFFWVLLQQGRRKIAVLAVATFFLAIAWINMPTEKQERIRTIWDEGAGPANAHLSAEGRMKGFDAGLTMFRDAPLTGVGAGGKNFVSYRVEQLDGIPEQAHNLYAEVLSEFGVGGGTLFVGLVVSVCRCCFVARCQLLQRGGAGAFSYSLCGAIIVTIMLLLLLGMAGHNFYRPLWLWLAAWAASLMRLSTHGNYL